MNKTVLGVSFWPIPPAGLISVTGLQAKTSVFRQGLETSEGHLSAQKFQAKKKENKIVFKLIIISSMPQNEVLFVTKYLIHNERI